MPPPSMSPGPVPACGNVFADSSTLMACLLDLHFPGATILDATYGHGVFYKKTKRAVTGLDLRPTGQVVADNARLPFADDSFDLGVLDPPYKRGNDNNRYTNRYGTAPDTEQKVTRLYHRALPELLRVCRRGMVVKCQDATDGHRFYARHIQICDWVRSHTGLDVHDIAVVARHRVPNNNYRGRRRYFQQSVSYFLVWSWRSKHPFRPVRF
jgi:hypothetical protein